MNTSEIKNHLNVTNMIYYSLLTGLIIFFVVVIFLTRIKTREANAELDKIFIFLVPLFGLAMMFISRMIYNQQISKSDSKADILQKIIFYRTAKIISWAMIEGACFLSLVATMITLNYLYLVVFIFLIGFFILMRPSKESFIKEMKLNSEESDMILRRLG